MIQIRRVIEPVIDGIEGIRFELLKTRRMMKTLLKMKMTEIQTPVLHYLSLEAEYNGGLWVVAQKQTQKMNWNPHISRTSSSWSLNMNRMMVPPSQDTTHHPTHQKTTPRIYSLMTTILGFLRMSI